MRFEELFDHRLVFADKLKICIREAGYTKSSFAGSFAGAFVAFAGAFAASFPAFAGFFAFAGSVFAFAFVLFLALELFTFRSLAFFFSAKKHTSFFCYFSLVFYSMA